VKNFNGRTAVITGAAGGLGKALAMELNRQHCNLVLIDIDSTKLHELRSQLQNDHLKISIHIVDISKEEQVKLVRKEIVQQHANIHILINNAGISISQPFQDINLDDFRQLIDVNFWGTVYCTKYFLNDLKKQAESRLVNIISDFAMMGFPGKTAYGSSKSAVMGFTNAIKTELSETAVKVSLVIPPPMDTGIIKNSKHINDKKRQSEETFLKKNGMPLDQVARSILKQIRKGRFRIVIGNMMFFIDIASRLFPTWLHSWIGKNKKRFDFI